MLDSIKHPCLKCLVRPACKNLDNCDITKQYKEFMSKVNTGLSVAIVLIASALFWFIIIKYTGSYVHGLVTGFWVIGGIAIALLFMLDTSTDPSQKEFYLFIGASTVIGIPGALFVAVNSFLENLTIMKT